MVTSELRGRRRGAVAVETALVMIAMTSLVFGIFEYSRLLMDWDLLNNAAREGCRYALANNTNPSISANVQSTVTNFMAGRTRELQLLHRDRDRNTPGGLDRGEQPGPGRSDHRDGVWKLPVPEHHSTDSHAHHVFHKQRCHNDLRGRDIEARAGSVRRSSTSLSTRSINPLIFLLRTEHPPSTACNHVYAYSTLDRKARFSPRYRSALCGSHTCGPGWFPGTGDRSRDGCDRQDPDPACRGPRRADRGADGEWRREHRLQPEQGNDQRAAHPHLQRHHGDSRFSRLSCN